MTLGELFLKSLRWFIFISLIIGGIAAVIAVEEGNIKPMMLAVFGFGGAYLMSDSWRDLPNRVMIISIIWVIFTAFLADKLPNIAYNATGYVIPWNFYIVWVGISLFPGVPVMMFIFKTFDD